MAAPAGQHVPALSELEEDLSMVHIQLLLRAVCQSGRRGMRLVMPPAVALAAAIAAAGALGLHPLHAVLSAGAHLLAFDSTLSSGGGPPNP